MSIPLASKKPIITDCASSGKSRTVTPPAARSERTPKRVTGTVATSRSATSTPPALRPATTDCFSILAARLVSRETVTVAPRGIVVAYAIARRTANSGEMSTFARPETPVRPNR